MAHSEDQMAHVASPVTLVGTFVALIALTLATVFGGESNLTIALIIAGIKATLVALNFMHLRFDRAFHAIGFASALLAMLLFFGLTVIDTEAYQDSVIWEDAPAAAAEGEAAAGETAAPAAEGETAPAPAE